MDILIYAKPELVKHKFKENVKEGCYCYWTTNRLPAKEKILLINNVMFSDGNKIYARGEFLWDITEEICEICFNPLEKVNLKQPKKPPTRG